MVGVAQSVELWIVAPAVAGSNPVAHPIFTKRKMLNILCFFDAQYDLPQLVVPIFKLEFPPSRAV